MSVVAVYITENRLQELQNIWLAWPERARGFGLSSVNLDQNQRQTNAAVVCCLRLFISLLFDFANDRSKTDIAGKLLLLNTGLLTTVEWHSSNQKSQAQIHATFWSLKRTDKRDVEKEM